MNQLEDFIHKVKELPECGLILSKDTNSLISSLEEDNFKCITTISEVISDNKYFVLLNKENIKYWYDFCSQYLIGEIQYREENIEKMISLNPIKTSIILVISENDINNTTPDIRIVTGLTITV
jgi:hypothetical protein